MHNKKLIWNGVEKGIPKLLRELAGLKKLIGIVKLLWFLRADEQIELLIPRKILKTQHEIFKNLQAEHEIGWHPHLWRWNTKYRCWYQETEDMTWIELCMMHGFHTLSEQFKLQSIRMGWNFQTNFTLALLEKLGLKIDFSAAPGIAEKNYIAGTELLVNTRDWSITPSQPYYPSTTDYRRPKNGNEASRTILEVPETTFSLPLPLRAVQVTKRLIHAKPFHSPVTEPYLTREPYLFKYAIERALRSKLLVCCFHPDELLATAGKYSITNLIKNLKLIANTARKNRLELRFLTGQEFYSDAQNRFAILCHGLQAPPQNPTGFVEF